MNAGSLQDLLDTVGAVPENCLKEIAHQVLRGLDYLGVPHNCVSSTQILFNKDARVKISLGIRAISHPQPEQASGSMAQDLFELGHVLLQAATGGFLDNDILPAEKLRESHSCCVLHANAGIGDSKLQLHQLVNKERFSEEMLSFLCSLLKSDPA